MRDLRPTKRSARASGRQRLRSLLGVAVRKGWRPKVLWGGSLCAGGGPGRGGRAALGPETGVKARGVAGR